MISLESWWWRWEVRSCWRSGRWSATRAGQRMARTLPRVAAPTTTTAPSPPAISRSWPAGLLERRRDVPQRQLRLLVAAGLLPLGQRDVAVGQRLVGDLAEQVADDVETAAHLVVGVRDIPRRPHGVGSGEHRVPCPGVVIPAAVGLQVHVRQLPDLPRVVDAALQPPGLLVG